MLVFFFLVLIKVKKKKKKKRNVVHSLGPCLSGVFERLMAHSIGDGFGLSSVCDLLKVVRSVDN